MSSTPSSFPSCAAGVDIRHRATNLAGFVIGSLATFEIGPERIKDIFDPGFAFNDVAQYVLFDLVRHEGVMDKFQLPGSNFIEQDT